ncbi:hypothetical protein PT2222_420042 [Paraburkholderia tropica]
MSDAGGVERNEAAPPRRSKARLAPTLHDIGEIRVSRREERGAVVEVQPASVPCAHAPSYVCIALEDHDFLAGVRQALRAGHASHPCAHYRHTVSHVRSLKSEALLSNVTDTAQSDSKLHLIASHYTDSPVIFDAYRRKNRVNYRHLSLY